MNSALVGFVKVDSNIMAAKQISIYFKRGRPTLAIHATLLSLASIPLTGKCDILVKDNQIAATPGKSYQLTRERENSRYTLGFCKGVLIDNGKFTCTDITLGNGSLILNINPENFVSWSTDATTN